MASPPIYLDHHATTPVDDRVLAAMMPYFQERFGNAASTAHVYGTVARDAVEEGRVRVAALLDCKPEELTFTSGATESDNLAIVGAARAREARGNHIVTVRTEHKAVLDTCEALTKQGWQVTFLDVDESGIVPIEAVASAITKDTILVSVMLANNEVGVLQDIASIGALARERDVLFHCDAAQGLGYLPFSVRDLNVDLVSVSAHKMYGPKGVGALYVRQAVRARGIPEPQIAGGGHEHGLRSGTLNVPGIVGFGVAAQIMKEEGPTEATRIARLRDALRDRLLDTLDEVRLNGAADRRHPGNLNLSFGYLDGARLLLELCEHVAVSSGAACSSAEPGPSYVLEAMGVPKEWAAASVRFGIGRSNTQEEIATVGDVVIDTVHRLRERSPLWKRKSQGKPVQW
ncbi:MAG: aminotransferase class V-fold PLP-dependent enzyme [Myxococcales bacterium]|nr:aminotransferase class V-fold PLP-dependent enzyme [Myxococcales bacterium]